MDTQTAALVEQCDELSSEWELRLAELKLMQLSIADLDGESAEGAPRLKSRLRVGRADPC